MWNRGITAFIRIGFERHPDALDQFLELIRRNHWRLDQAMAELPNELRTLIAPILTAASNERIEQYQRAQAFLDEAARQRAPDYLEWLEEAMPFRT